MGFWIMLIFDEIEVIVSKKNSENTKSDFKKCYFGFFCNWRKNFESA